MASRAKWRRGFACILGLALLAGCDDGEQAPPTPPVRAIKYMILEVGAAAQQRRISGVVEAGATSNVAFQTSGQVIELKKKVGDAVSAGDLLARLDPEPLRLELASAESELQQANASVADAESKYQQQKQLFEKGFATRTSFESALANLRTARGARGVAQSRLQISKRNLAKSEIIAPFSGVIARREVEPFEEVASGQSIYMLQTEGENEVKVSLPETLIGAVSLGETVSVMIPLASAAPLPGRITEIAPLAEGVNAYPVAIRLDEEPPGLRPGMSAQAIFEFRTGEADGAFTVPISAVKPSVEHEGGQVFVYKDGHVSPRDVVVVNVRDNALQIKGDIEAGEIIATAGVSLLYDGMPARLLDPKALR